MTTNFRIRISRHGGDLHVHPIGVFDGSSAWELINLLMEGYDGHGRVFIDTAQLTEVCPFGRAAFLAGFHRCGVPADRVVFGGERGSEIAVRGSRVSMEREGEAECGCGGGCAECSCRGKGGEKRKTGT
jgi:hypothetical protein